MIRSLIVLSIALIVLIPIWIFLCAVSTPFNYQEITND